MILRVATGLVLALALAGCQAGYYAHLARGQYDLLARRQPIAELLAAPETDPALREQLTFALEARAFASRDLGLPDNDSYKSYADLERPYAVWNVFAAPEFSLGPYEWCYGLFGCYAYRGYYDRAQAEDEAARLRLAGLDALVVGVPAYSTLGWFDDPVLNTLLRGSRDQIAGTVIHELAHQQLFAGGDTAFNESFATFVEEEGLRRFLATRPALARAARERLARERAFVELVTAARRRLETLYASGRAPETMRELKRGEIERLRAEYAARREEWGNNPGYNAWFAGEINNARLLPFGLYYQWVGAFAALFAQSGGDWRAFFDAAEALADLDADERRQRLEALAATAPKR